MRSTPSNDLTLTPTEALILGVIHMKPDLYGLAIRKCIIEGSGGALRMPVATLYTSLRQLQVRGHVRGRSAGRRDYYTITTTGKTALAEAARFHLVMSRFLPDLQ